MKSINSNAPTSVNIIATLNPSDDSASGSHTLVSTPELPKLPYEIFLLVVEAFLESAHAEFSIDPASWELECEPIRRNHIPIPEV